MKRIFYILLLSFISISLGAQEAIDYHVDSLVFVSDNHAGGSILVENLQGFSCDLRAIPSTGYSFLKWSDGETDNPRHYTQIKSEAADMDFWAVFTCDADMTQNDGHIEVTVDSPTTPSFFLEVKPNPSVSFYKWDNGDTLTKISYLESDGRRYPFYSSEQGTLIFTFLQRPGGIVTKQNQNGLECDLVATPNAGYTFLKWADGNTNNPRHYVHGGNELVDEFVWAVFTKDEDMTSPGGSITVSIVDPAIPSYLLTVTPDEGAEFYKWDNGVTSKSVNYVESDGRRYPYFKSNVGTLIFEYNNHPGGTVEAQNINGLQYDLVATANTGYTFLKWADGNTQNPRPYTHGGDDKVDEVAFAVFTKNSDMTTAGGIITVAIDDENIPSYQLTINLNEGVEFYKWDNGEEEKTIDYLESDGNRYPYFKSLAGVLTFDFDQHPGGIVSVDNVEGLNLDLIATANAGYTFQQWADGNTQNPRPYTHGGDEKVDEIAYAVFTRDQDVVQESGYVTVTVDDQNIPSFELNAQNSSCAEFRAWASGETSNVLSYVESDGTKVPVFDFGDHQVLYEVENEPGGHIEVTPGTCQFTYEAIPDQGWHFTYWEDDHSLPATRVVPYAAGEYIAHFMKSAYIVADNTYATFEEAQSAASVTTPIELVNDVAEPITVTKPISIEGNGHIVGDLTIACGALVNLTNALSVNNLYLNATTGSSAQLKNYTSNLTCSNAYIDIKLESNANAADPNKWYGFTVPFEVDVENGIARKEGSASHVSGTDYLVWNYDGNKRATTGTGWVKMYGGTLEPGKFYMIGIDGTQNVWRFTKKSGSALGGAATIDLPAYTGSEIDGGWNAVGNSTVQYVAASITDIPYVQVYNNSQSRYVPKLLDRTSFVVGCPFFAQVEGANTLTLSPSDETNPSNLYTPRRMGQSNATSIYEIKLKNDQEEDVVFISAADDALDSYQRGKDLVKLSYSNQYPQIFSYAYGQILCAQHSPLGEDGTIFPVYLSVPKSGMYEISASQGECPIYLLENNVPIAEISESSYLLSLPSGITTKYSVSIGTQRALPTGMNTNKADAESIDKIILNNRLFIICGDKVYNAQGSQVR